MIQNMDKLGNQDSGLLGPHAHRQLVAKIMHRCKAHAGQAQMLANRRNVLQVKFIQRHNAVDLPAARRITHRVQQILQRQLFRHEKHFVDGFTRPIPLA